MTSPFKNILCPVKLNEYSLSALDGARAIASLLGPNETTIYLLHLLPVKVSLSDPSVTSASDGVRLVKARCILNQAAARRLGYVPYHVIIGYASNWARADIVLDTAVKVQAGLVVMATHGRIGLYRLLHGSVAEEVTRRASCPVLTVGPNAFNVRRRPRHSLLYFPYGPDTKRSLHNVR